MSTRVEDKTKKALTVREAINQLEAIYKRGGGDLPLEAYDPKEDCIQPVLKMQPLNSTFYGPDDRVYVDTRPGM